MEKYFSDYDIRLCPDCGKKWKFYRRYRDGRQMIKAEGNPNIRQRCYTCLARQKAERAERGYASRRKKS